MTPPTPHAAPTTILAGPGAPQHHHYSDIAATRDLFWQNIVREILMSLSMVADARRSEIIAEMHTRLGQFRVGNAVITTPPDLGPAVPAPQLAAKPQSTDQRVHGDEDGSDESPGTPGDAVIPGASSKPAHGSADQHDEDQTPDAALPRPGYHPSMPLTGQMAVLTKGGERIPIADVRPLLACSVPGTDAERALSIDVQCTIFQIVAPSGEVFTLPLHEIRAVHAITEDLMARLQKAAHQQDAQSGRSGDDPDAKPFGFAAFTSLARSKA